MVELCGYIYQYSVAPGMPRTSIKSESISNFPSLNMGFLYTCPELVFHFTHTHTSTHTHTHTHTSVFLVWHPARHGTEAVCKRCELPVKNPHYGFLSEQGRPSYGCQRVGLTDGDRFIGRAKMEGRNFYGGFGISSTVSRPSVR